MYYYKCNNCGYSVKEGSKFCPECGSPLMDTYEDDDTYADAPKRNTKKEKKKRSPIRRLIVWAIIIALAIWGKLEYDAYNYGINLHNTGYYISTSATHLDNAGVLSINMWNNLINRNSDEETDKYTRADDGNGQFYSDINVAFEVLVNDKAYKDEISQAVEARDEAYNLMGQLTNPPKRYQEAYRDMKEFYSDYMEFFDIATNPNGSFEEYREKYLKARDTYVKSSYSVSMY